MKGSGLDTGKTERKTGSKRLSSRWKVILVRMGRVYFSFRGGAGDS